MWAWCFFMRALRMTAGVYFWQVRKAGEGEGEGKLHEGSSTNQSSQRCRVFGRIGGTGPSCAHAACEDSRQSPPPSATVTEGQAAHVLKSGPLPACRHLSQRTATQLHRW